MTNKENKETNNTTNNKAKKENIMPGPDMPENMSSIDRLPVTIHSQYIKDLSFENPGEPMPSETNNDKPSLNVDFSMDAKQIERKDDVKAYEVILYVSVNAKKGESTTFIIELEYGMAVTLQDVPEDKVHPLLLVEMPNYMFPYVRQIVSDMTQAGGYRPFMLAPVNFKALYRSRFGGPQVTDHQKEKEEEEKQTETA